MVAAALARFTRHQKTSSVNMCNSAQGVMFDLEDKEAQQEVEGMMTPLARAATRAALGRMDVLRANQGAALLQMSFS